MFQIRAGKLVGRLGFIVEYSSIKSGNLQGDIGAILQRALEEHYQSVESVEIPTEILVQAELTDEEILSDWLSEKKGRKVSIVVPQRKTKAELVGMVERNAEYELARMQKNGRSKLASDARFSRDSQFTRTSPSH